MRSAAFAFLLLMITAAAVWLGLRMIINTDPDSVVNVLIFLLALFLAASSFGALCAWALWARRWREPKGYQIAVRQGAWAGLVAALVAVLQMWQLLTWLAVGAMLLVFGGVEALLLLQPEPVPTPSTEEAESSA
jgi:hypothetical protein